MNKFIEKLRDYIGDNKEPYLISNSKLNDYINSALYEYSRYRPIKRKAVIKANKPYLPKDYITWISGLEDCCILENTITTNTDIELLYYAVRNIYEVLNINLIMEYCLSETIVDLITKDAKNIDEAVHSMELGQGLKITFEESENKVNKLYAIAKDYKKHFYEVVKNKKHGGWY